MKNTGIVNNRRVGAGYTWAQLRPVLETTFYTNANFDSTKSFILPFSNDYADYSTGIPRIFHFQVIKNENIKITKANGILDLTIPILPVGWDTNSKQDMDDFVKNAKDPEAIKNQCYGLTDKEYSRRINEGIVEAYNFILFSLAERYAEALKSGDKNTAALIKNMAIMQESGFNFNEFLKLMQNKSNYAVSANPQFGTAYVSYLKAKDKYQELLNVLQEYRTYDAKNEIKDQNTAHTKAMFNRTSPVEPQPGE